MTSNFAFLKEHFPVLANFGRLAESYCYSDANSCLMKLGMIGETIINMMFAYDKIRLPKDNQAVTKINILQKEGLLPSDLVAPFHTLRKARNKAAHCNYDSVEQGKAMLEMTYGICEWFMQTYGDYQYEHKPFVMPSDVIAEEVTNVEAEKAAEEKLVGEAIAVAEQTPAIDKKERIAKAVKFANQRMKSEAETRLLIDEQLRQVGWEADTVTLRYSKGTRPEKGRNLAIAEWPTNSSSGKRGFADYALFVGLKLVGIIEAKAEHKDIPSVIDYQGKDYPRNIRKEDEQYIIGTWGDYKAPFTFATNGRPYLEQYRTKSGIWFLDLREPYNAPKALRGWFSPDGLLELLGKDIATGNKNLEETPYDLLLDRDGLNLRPYQLKAVQAAEQAVVNGQQNILLAMATGTGKTRTVLGLIYRFLKSDRFKRILFLVDRTALGEQAVEVFEDVKLEDLLTLHNIYNIKDLDDKFIDRETRVHVATVQSMMKRILLNDDDKKPSVGDYDLVIVDEAHRGYIMDKEMAEAELLYSDQRDFQSKYRAVIEYFDATKIALTATPALHTTEIFGAPVFRYTYREAVIEGYLVDHDAPHNIMTELRKEGIHYKKGDTVSILNPITGEITNIEDLEDELDFEIEQFNKKVLNPSFNETVLKEVARNIDPEEPGKTLIFAVDDNHADLIVSILKNIYSETGVDNDAVMKITGSIGGGNPKKVSDAIKRFKNERYPSIVVTVDLLTTGIDIHEICNLVFMRRVKSRILFEQMLGRATRLCPEIKKTHFEIYDPVGVYESLEDVNTMKPVVANANVTFDKLLDGLEEMQEEAYVSYQIDQIIAKLQRKKRNMTTDALEQFKYASGGFTPDEFINNLRGKSPVEAKRTLLAHQEAFGIFNKYYVDSKPKVVSDHKDTLLKHTRDYGKSDKPEDYLDAFAEFVRNNMNKIAALNVICTRPKDLTRESLKRLRLELDLENFTEKQLNTAISQLTNEEMAADIITLIRRYAIGSALISHEARIRKAVDKLCKAHDFTKQELNWIKRMGKYLIEESVLNVKVFDEDSRFKGDGGFVAINKKFSGKLEDIVLELNEYLYDDGGRLA